MPVIPPDLLQKLLAFCAREATGQIVLHVDAGRISGYALTETGKVAHGDCLPPEGSRHNPLKPKGATLTKP